MSAFSKDQIQKQFDLVKELKDLQGIVAVCSENKHLAEGAELGPLSEVLYETSERFYELYKQQAALLESMESQKDIDSEGGVK